MRHDKLVINAMRRLTVVRRKRQISWTSFGEGNAKVNCSEVQCEGACDAGSAKVSLARRSEELLDKLMVKAIRR